MKKLLIYLPLLLALSCLLALVGCDELPEIVVDPVDYEGSYEWVYDLEFTKEYDDYMKVDGVLDEDVWSDETRNWLTFTQYGCTLSYTTYFTEKGLYIAAIAEDDDIYWNGRMNFNNGSSRAFNSAFFFAIAEPGVDVLQMQSRFQFAFDTKNKGSYEMTPFAAKATADADVESGDATKMWGEFFVTWEDILVDVDAETGVPNEICLIPYYRHVVDVEEATANHWVCPLNADRNITQCYATWDVNGYTAATPEGSLWGNAVDGTSHTTGWDVSQIEDGIVTTNRGYNQAIFFTGGASSAYRFSVDMKVIRGYRKLNSRSDSGDGIFRGGICAMSSPTDLSAVLMVGDGMKNGQGALYHLVQDPWVWTSVDSVAIPGYDWEAREQTVRLEVIKDGMNFYYFLEGKYFGYEQVTSLSGVACPGVYTMNSEASFSNPTFIDYSKDPAALHAALSEYLYFVDAPLSVPNGSISLSASVVDKAAADRTVIVTLNPNNGCVLSTFRVNGADMMDYVRANIRRGTLSLTIGADTELDIAFTQFSKRYETVTLRGETFLSNGTTRAAGATVRVWDPANPLFDYTLTANSQGKFEIAFLKPQDDAYEIDGATYVVGSSWNVSVLYPDGYAPCNATAAADAVGTGDILLLPALVAGTRIEPVGGTPTSSVYNADGTFTITSKSQVTAGRLFATEVGGKNWTAEVDLATAEFSAWNAFGFMLALEDGTYRLIGISQRSQNDRSALYYILRDAEWRGEIRYDSSAALSSVFEHYLEDTYLTLKMQYADGVFTLYVNDVLYVTTPTASLAITDPGKITGVGFGTRLDDGLPHGMTFANWSYTADGDDTYIAPIVGLPDGLTQADAEKNWNIVHREDGTVSISSTLRDSPAVIIDASSGALASQWLAEIDIKTSEMSIWHTYGITAYFADGQYLLIGARQYESGGATSLCVTAWLVDTYKRDVTLLGSEEIGAVIAGYGSAATLNVKVAYDAGTYSVYLNDVLYGTVTAETLGIDTLGDPVAVGFGARLDHDSSKGMTFSGWSWCVGGSDAYATEKEKLGF